MSGPARLRDVMPALLGRAMFELEQDSWRCDEDSPRIKWESLDEAERQEWIDGAVWLLERVGVPLIELARDTERAPALEVES